MSSPDDKRTGFFVKFVMVGGMGAAGLALIYGGLNSLQKERGLEAVALLVLGVGLGLLFLRGAWKAAGE